VFEESGDFFYLAQIDEIVPTEVGKPPFGFLDHFRNLKSVG